jgi:hypothetical protein
MLSKGSIFYPIHTKIYLCDIGGPVLPPWLPQQVQGLALQGSIAILELRAIARRIRSGDSQAYLRQRGVCSQTRSIEI